jgi:hypothetical protein
MAATKAAALGVAAAACTARSAHRANSEELGLGLAAAPNSRMRARVGAGQILGRHAAGRAGAHLAQPIRLN